MKILWFTWKDRKHPQAGGAETVNEELAKRLVRDNHEVIFLVAGFPDCQKEESIGGYKIIRLGGQYSVYWKAFCYYKKNLQGWADLVIDEVNTVPFFCKLFVRERNILFFHQLCREIWFYQAFFPLNIFGYLLEPLYLLLLSAGKVVTVSQSSKKDLMRFGFKSKNISVISTGIEVAPVDNLQNIQKYEKPTVLSLGAFREMKRTEHQIEAFEIAKKNIPDLQMKLAGSSAGVYGKRVLELIRNSSHKKDIEYLGRVSEEQKIELMQKSHCILVTSVKEGWGLIVTEANSQGTPAIGYDVDGLRDSICDKKTGFLSAPTNTPYNLAMAILRLLENKNEYEKIRKNAWVRSKNFSFERSYQEFIKVIENI